MNRYKTDLWVELVALQNARPNQDILTITGFMDDDEFLAHVQRYRNLN